MWKAKYQTNTVQSDDWKAVGNIRDCVVFNFLLQQMFYF